MKTLKQLANQYTWQPIETAPKDGTTMLLWHKDFDFGTGVSYWSETYNKFLVGERPQPTHWMPLPPSTTEPNPIPQIIEVMEQMARALELVKDIGVHEPVLASAHEVTHIKAVENDINEALAAYKKLCEGVE